MSGPIGLFAQNQLARTSQAISRSLERLSSGSRVNRPSDDVAAFSEGQKLTAQVRGLTQANSNINQTQGLLMTAETALSSQSDILKRMREIALQGSSSTLSSTSRDSLSSELKSLLTDFEKITETAEFNGQKLLTGDFSGRSIQIGNNSTSTASLSISALSASKTFLKNVGTGTFKVATTISSVTSSEQVIGDFNNDGHQDVIFTSTGKTYLGSGDGKLFLKYSGLSGLNEVVLGDVNNDGIQDLIGADGGNQFTINLGNGDGTFQTQTVRTAAATQLNNTQLADFNGDGALDIVGTDLDTTDTLVAMGNGDGTFVAPVGYSSGGVSPLTEVRVGDVNRDGIMDVVGNARDDKEMVVFLGNGNGTFQTATTFTQDNTNGLLTGHTNIALADYDRDGILDLVASGGINDGNQTQIDIYKGNGNGTFQDAVRNTTINYNGNAAMNLLVKDLNGDGTLDIGTADSLGLSRISWNKGSLTAASTTTVSTYMIAQYADFNEDGVQDALAFNSSTSRVNMLNGLSSQTAATGDILVSTEENASKLLKIVDQAISKIDLERANIAALHSRLDFAAASNLLVSDSLSEAKSRATDVEVTTELAEFTKNQILQNAQTAVLAQANVQAQIVAQLLQ